MLKAERDELRKSWLPLSRRQVAADVILQLLDDLDAKEAKLAQCRAVLFDVCRADIAECCVTRGWTYDVTITVEKANRILAALSDAPAEHPEVADAPQFPSTVPSLARIAEIEKAYLSGGPTEWGILIGQGAMTELLVSHRRLLKALREIREAIPPTTITWRTESALEEIKEALATVEGL